MIEEEWYCDSCGCYCDNLDPAEGKTCAYCGSTKVKLWDGESGGTVDIPICFLNEPPTKDCRCILHDICWKYKDSIFSQQLRRDE